MDAERVRAQLDRILASAAFASGGRARSFLRFVVERALAGRAAEIKEAVIAVEALGRPPSFDPKADPIVRVEAGRLRDRLRTYYGAEGEADALLIDLPKGGYVPRFAERGPAAPSSAANVLRLSVLPPSGTTFDAFAVSPDGRHLAFTALLNGTPMLWVRALDALEARPLAGTEFAAYPFWSPDSRSIGFFAPSRLRRIDVAGGPPQDVADIVVGRGGAWSADGIIVFNPRPFGPLHRVPATGGDPAPVTALDASRAELAHGFPQFLPDGRRFIYSAMSTRTGESSIRVGSLDGGAGRVLLESDTSALYAPRLLGRSDALVFVSGNDLLAQGFDVERLELRGEPTVIVPQVRSRRWYQARVSVSADGLLLYQTGSAEHHRFCWLDRAGRLLESIGPPNDAMSFSLSPDERHVAFYRDDDPATVCPKIWVMDLSRDGAAFRLTENEIPEAEMTPIWSPDGADVLLSRGDDRGMRLLRQPLRGGAPECVLDSEGPKFASDWSSDGRYVAFTSQVPDYKQLHVWLLDCETKREARPFLQHSYSESNARFAPAAGAESPR